MKHAKKNLLLSFVLALVLAAVTPAICNYPGNILQVEAAAAPKLNKTKTTNLKLGKKLTLKVKNANKKVKWTSSNKKIVKITKTSGSKKQNATI